LEEDKRVLEVIRRQTRSVKPLGGRGFAETLSGTINLPSRVRERLRKK
jgi:hypothetical protein